MASIYDPYAENAAHTRAVDNTPAASPAAAGLTIPSVNPQESVGIFDPLDSTISQVPRISPPPEPPSMVERAVKSVTDNITPEWKKTIKAIPTHAVEGVRQGTGGVLRLLSDFIMPPEVQRDLESKYGIPPKREDESPEAIASNAKRMKMLSDLSDIIQSDKNALSTSEEPGRRIAGKVAKYGSEMTDVAAKNLKESTPENLSFWQKALLTSAQSLGVSAPALLASAFAKSPVPALSAMGASTIGQSYDQYIRGGADFPTAVRGAFIDGAVEVLTEKIPLDTFLKLGKGTPFVKWLKTYVIQETATENVATLLQNANAYATLHPDATAQDWYKDYVKQIPEQAALTTASTLITTGIQGGAAGLINKAIHRGPTAEPESPVEPPPPPGPLTRAVQKALPAQVINVDQSGNAFTDAQVEAEQARKDELGLTPDVEQAAAQRSSQPIFDPLQAEDAEIAQETPHAIQIRGDQGQPENQIPETGSQPGGGLEVGQDTRGEDIQQPQEEGSATSNEVQPVAKAKLGEHPSETVVGTHFSNEQRPVLSGEKFGTGIRAAEAQRLSEPNVDPRLKSRVSFYVDEGNGVKPEQGLGSVPHKVELKNMYNGSENPLGFPRNPNEFEKAVLDNGYSGYYIKNGYDKQGRAVVLGDAAKSIKVPKVEAVKVINEHQTKTPEFKKWFGDSKVVDKKGEPLVVYHSSTYGDFNIFDKDEQRFGMAGYGFYFSDVEGANIYSKHADTFKLDKAYDGSEKKVNTMPVYLSMRNPLIVDNINDALTPKERSGFGVARKYNGVGPDEKSRIEKLGYDGVIGNEYIKFKRDGSMDVVTPGTKGAIKHPVYVVFDPTQIKSAIGNSGSFDPNNPNITASLQLKEGQPKENVPTKQTAHYPKIAQAVREASQEFPNVPSPNVVQTAKELPEGARRPYESRGQLGLVQGLYVQDHGGKRSLHVVSDAISSPNEAKETVRHETLHLLFDRDYRQGGDEVLKRRLDNKLEDLYAAFGEKKLAPIIKGYFPEGNFDKSNKAHRLLVAEEKFAQLAESNPKNSLFKQILTVIRDWLQRLGVKFKMSDADAVAFIQEAFARSRTGQTDQKAVVNIGLATNDGRGITAEQAISALEDAGVMVVEHNVKQSNTEPTLVAQLSRPLTPEEANSVSKKLNQEAIAQMVGDNGELYGPKAKEWGPFNKEYFLPIQSSQASLKQLKDQTKTTAFKRWFKGSKVVDESGNPLVVYHGTVSDFESFNRSRSNPESDFGSGFYFTNTQEDVGENYAGIGPDLTHKIERRAEELMSERYENKKKHSYGTPEYKRAYAKAKRLAQKEFVTHKGAVIPAYLSIKNPVEIGGKKDTTLDYEAVQDKDGEYTGEENGSLVDFVVSLRNLAEQHDGDANESIGKIMEWAIDNGGIKASKLMEMIGGDEKFHYTEEDGKFIDNEIVRQAFEDSGFDGIVDHTVNKKFGSEKRFGKPMAGMYPDTVHYIAFHPEQIKSAIGNKGTFDASNPNITASLQETGPIFYSEMQHVLSSKLPNSGPVDSMRQQIANMAKSGQFKQEEYKWSGIDEWLAERKSEPVRTSWGVKRDDGFFIYEGNDRDKAEALAKDRGWKVEKITRGGPYISKSEIIEFLEANEVKVEEVQLGGEGSDISEVEAWWNDEGGANEEVPFNDLSESEKQSAISRYRDEVGNYLEGATKFHQYQLPGGNNYRELLLTLPPNESFEQWADKVGFDLEDEKQLEEAKFVYQDSIAAGRGGQSGDFRSSHFSEPNILAHVRFNERTDAEGKKVLFIEEIQSDWAQKGKREGFESRKEKEWIVRLKEDGAVYRRFGEDGEIAARKLASEHPELELAEGERTIPSNVPSAPFVGKTDSWVSLSMRRMIRYAADNGFDRVAWTTGEQQASRYDLSKQISSIKATRTMQGAYAIEARNTVLRAGRGAVVVDDVFDAARLPDVVGKELADKIVGQTDGSHTYSGLDLKVGGEGMIAFYDQIVPSIVNKYVKKWGAKVGETAINKDVVSNPESMEPDVFGDLVPSESSKIEQEGVTVHSFDITPAMKESVMQGQPLFRKSQPASSGLSVSRLQEILATPISRLDGTIGIEIVQSGSDFEAMSGMVIPDDAVSAYFDGKVWMIADRLTEKNARKYFTHEVVGHLALERMLSKKELKQLLNQIQLMKVSGNQTIVAAAAHVFDKYGKAQALNIDGSWYGFLGDHQLRQRSSKEAAIEAAREQEAKEILAYLAENGIQNSLIRRVVAAIRQFLARMGLGDLQTAEIESLIAQAARFVEGKAETGMAQAEPAFARAGEGQRLRKDNPGGEWLSRKRQDTIGYGRNKFGNYNRFGSVTAWYEGPVVVPVSVLSKVKGMRGEQDNVRQGSLDGLVKIMGETGKLPIIEETGTENMPFIMVDQDGVPWVNEGNHRIMAAQQLGWKSLPVNIRYFNGGESVDGLLAPKNIDTAAMELPEVGTFARSGEKDQTETPEFKKWFGDSKVVDEHGKPLKVYHGTNSDFVKFVPNDALGGGMFFSPDPKEASVFASARGANVMSAYLKAEKIWPKTVRSYDEVVTISKAKNGGYDAVRVRDSVDGVVNWVVFRPEQIKSAIGNSGSFDPNNPNILFARKGEPTQSQQVEDTIDNASLSAYERISNKASEWSSNLLGALTLKHLSDIGKQHLPHIGPYVNAVDQMQARKNDLQTESAKIADRWIRLAQKNRKASDQLATLMHDSTIAGVDPSSAYLSVDIEAGKEKIKTLRQQIFGRSGEDSTEKMAEVKKIASDIKAERSGARRLGYDTLRTRFSLLPQEHRDMYREVRDHYQKRARQVLDALIERIKATSTNKDSQLRIIDRLRLEFESRRLEGPYFPLARFGDYWLYAKDYQGEPLFEMFEGVNDLRKRQKALQADGATGLKVGSKLEQAFQNVGANAAFMSDIAGLLDDMGGTKAEEVKDDIYQLFLKTLPELSTRRAFIHRKKTKGYSEDAIRAFAAKTFHTGSQLARLEKAHVLETAMEEMEKEVQDSADSVKSGHLLNEMQKRHEWISNPTDSKLANSLTGMGFIWHLGVSLAPAAVNLTQIATVAYPVLAGKFGPVRAFNALAKANPAAFGKLMTADERAMLEQLKKDGVIDTTYSHDLAGLAGTDTSEYNPRWQKTMQMASWAFHHAEVYNRVVTSVAAYRLSRQSGQSHEQAIETARSVTWESHFDYSNTNRARFMQANWQKVLFLFKQYSLNMTYYLARNAYLTMKGNTAAERKEAAIKLFGTLATTGLLSGASGLPLYSVVAFVANAIMSMFGDDDEPYDFEDEMYRSLKEELDDEWAKIILRGPTNELGADIASRVKLDELWVRSPQKELEGKAMTHHYIEQLLGPVMGIGINAVAGAQLMAEGNYYRGVEKMVPKSARDLMQSGRYAYQGALTMRGDPLVEEFDPWELVLRGAGFTPTKLSDRYEENSRVTNVEKRLQDRRQNLMDAYWLSKQAGDSDGMDDAKDAIHDWNDKHPGLTIGKDLGASMRQRLRYSRDQEGGVVVNKKYKKEVEPYR